MEYKKDYKRPYKNGSGFKVHGELWLMIHD